MTEKEREGQKQAQTCRELQALKQLKGNSIVCYPITLTLEGEKVVVKNQEEAEDILDIYSDMLEKPQD